MRCLAVGLAVVAACDARLHNTAPHGGADGPTGGSGDAALIDALEIDAPLGPWGTPQKITAAATAGTDEDDGTPSSNTLELYFAISSGGAKHLYVSTRMTAADPFGAKAPVSFASASDDETPRLSADDKTLYFASKRAGNGTLDIYLTTRATTADPWSNPMTVAVNTTGKDEKWYMPCGAAGYYVMVQNHGGTGTDLVEGTLGGAAATTIATLSSNDNETGTWLSPDCTTIYFASDRSGTTKLYTASRMLASDPWPAPTLVTDFDALGGAQEDPWISPDQRTFVFVSNVGGSKDVYISTR